MMKYRELTSTLPRAEKGATVIEYVLIAAFVALVLFSAFTALGINVGNKIIKVNTELFT